MGDVASRTTEPRHALTRGRLAVLLAVGLILFVAVSSDSLHAFLLGLVTAVGEIVSTRPVWGAVVFVLLSAMSAMLAFLSTGLIVPVALVTWGQMGTLFLLWLGWILGGVFAYTLSRFLGRQVITALTTGEALAYGGRVSAKAPFASSCSCRSACRRKYPGTYWVCCDTRFSPT